MQENIKCKQNRDGTKITTPFANYQQLAYMPN